GSGAQFVPRPEFADELFGKGQPLDATKFFIILPDGIGHGKSSKPSDGMHAKFPRYGYMDMVEAQYRLLTEGLGVSHARLVMGTSMGGMHTWLRGELHPDFMDALMPLASLQTRISGRNRVWRRIIIDAIGYDPGPNLEKIRAPLLAINSADDLINPPELRILEREIKRVPKGRAVIIPLSDKTRGHGSHTVAALWKDELLKLLNESKKQ